MITLNQEERKVKIMSKKNILTELKWRGVVKQITNEQRIIDAQLAHKGVYCGFDPTADSLHVGHLIPIILLERFNKAGFKSIALIGGGTGMIGDPSFKSDERVLQTTQQVELNQKAIEKQLKKIIPNVEFKNNADWLGSMKMIDFLRDVGKDFTLGYLLAKDSIARRIETGLSITEFSYTMLQAYDFYKLYSTADCYIQVGGSDQWGNITSGTDYIGTKVGRDKTKAAGLTINLLTKKDGQKFGKSEGGAVWLDPEKTSIYDFYQFWINQDDDDAEQLLKWLTFLTEDEIDKLVKQASLDPKQRLLQKSVAKEITEFVHGHEGLEQAIKVSEALFSGDLTKLTKGEFLMAFNTVDNLSLNKSTTIIDALVEGKVASSKREAREFLTANAISINGQVINDENLVLTSLDPLHEHYLFVKRGKKKFFGIKLKKED